MAVTLKWQESVFVKEIWRILNKGCNLRSLTQEADVIHIESSRGLRNKLHEFHKLSWVFDTSYYFNVEPELNKV